MRETLGARGAAQLVQHCPRDPRGLVTTDPQLSLKLLARGPRMVGGDQVDRPEPHPQAAGACRASRAGNDRRLRPAPPLHARPGGDASHTDLAATQHRQQNPSGHRDASRYSRQASSSAKRSWNSMIASGKPDRDTPQPPQARQPDRSGYAHTVEALALEQ